MERFIHVLFAGVLACAAQAALSQSSNQVAGETETYANVAAMGQSAERHAAPEAQVKPRIESLLEATGLAGSGPFPSRGGPLD